MHEAEIGLREGLSRLKGDGDDPKRDDEDAGRFHSGNHRSQTPSDAPVLSVLMRKGFIHDEARWLEDCGLGHITNLCAGKIFRRRSEIFGVDGGQVDPSQSAALPIND
jgi:hypothetical protein